MRYTCLLLLFLSISTQSSGQEKGRLFGGLEINTRVLFVNPFYELGNDRINHRGISGGVGIYKNLFIGAYGQWGYWISGRNGDDFESEYSRGGFLVGHVTRIKKSKCTLIPILYFAKGKSTSRQERPVSFVDAQMRYNILSPEIGLEYRFMRWGTVMISTGRHFYSRTDQDEQPIGFEGFDLNRYYGKIGVRFGI